MGSDKAPKYQAHEEMSGDIKAREEQEITSQTINGMVYRWFDGREVWRDRMCENIRSRKDINNTSSHHKERTSIEKDSKDDRVNQSELYGELEEEQWIKIKDEGQNIRSRKI